VSTGVLLVPYRKVAEEALADWRDADRRLSRITPDHPDWQAIWVLRELAKARYQEAVDSARAEHLPEPPPFEDVAEAT
jgi:hypothetical protein